ncbi:hypothetical protein SCOR_30225 [Sulfidibacter corallicola]|uniref:Uncharacterized protein n=1 Tax=Sulfidibacter corallicola TaxID=2818388 RepID=A0A8A4TLS9_SULCO|nr:hypothetical protein [Sulfidibacter corallicola]QTD50164.1 hypothetical protein J3U87_31655 [Sulfidibacter corallicola]
MSVLSMVLIGVLSIIGFCVLFFLSLYGFSFRMRRTSATFINHLIEHDWPAAYRLLATPIQDQVNFEAFVKDMTRRNLDTIAGIDSMSNFSIGISSGSIEPGLRLEDGIYRQIELHLYKESGAWKVIGIETGSAPFPQNLMKRRVRSREPLDDAPHVH